VKRLFLFAVILVAGTFILRDFVVPAWIRFPPPDARVIHISIPEGTTVSAAAQILEEARMIDSAWWYRVYARIDGDARKIQAGEYDLNEGMRFSSLANTLSRGPVREEVSITVIEGWTIADIEDHLRERDVDVRTSDFYAERFEEEFSFLKDLPAKTTLEGYLFPDTYRVWMDDLPDGLLRKQLSEFAIKTAELRAEVERSGRSWQDVVTLASIVEKEAKFDEDRPVVAGIFTNRLNAGMLLQSDATLNYVTRSGKSRLSSADLESTSPYNSYRFSGLPPTPIGNPGLASLRAAVDPAETNYYFFLTDEDGKAYFGRNLDEHIANRVRVFGR